MEQPGGFLLCGLATEDELRDTAHDAFLAFWRATDCDTAEAQWLAYCAAQEKRRTVTNSCMC